MPRANTSESRSVNPDPASTVIEDAKRLLCDGSATADAVALVLADIGPAVDRAAAALDALAERRRNVLLVGNDAELAEVEDAIKAQDRTKERLSARRKVLEQKLEELRRNSELENARARRAEIVKCRDAAAALLRDRYDPVSRELVNIVAVVAKAEAAVAAFNHSLEHVADDFDLEEVEGVESLVRKRPSKPERVLTSTFEDRLVTDAGGKFQGSLEKAKFDQEIDGWRVRTYDRGAFIGEEIVFRKRVKVETYLPAVWAALPPPLWQEVNLPGLVMGARPYWIATDRRFPGASGDFENAAARLAALPEHDVPRVEAQTREIPVANEGGK